jgi:putative ABC transport system ATP-binding protein
MPEVEMSKEKEIIIEIKNLRKVYKLGHEKVIALDHIDLNIFKGEICCILGTSGSGKSTLLNMMAGLEKPTKGTINIKGERISSMSENELAKFRQKHVGFIFQSYNLMASLTAIENVSMPMMFRRVPKAAREEEALRMLKAVELEKYILHKPNQMSGGQQQRVGIARAFVGPPAIIFADEPTGNLDSKTTDTVMQLMLGMAREQEQTLIIVTHDPHIAEYADKVVYILDGNVEKIELKQGEDTREYVHLEAHHS